MTPAAFLVACSERGIRVAATGPDGVLSLEPQSKATAPLRRYLERYDAEIRAFLPSAVVNSGNKINKISASVTAKTTEPEPFTLPEVTEKPLCASVLAIMPANYWEILLNVFRFSQDSYHVLDFVKRLNLSQDTLQSALDELVRRGAVRRCEGHPKAVCLHVPFLGSHGVAVPAVFYRGWPGNLSLSQLCNEKAPDAPVAAASLSILNINDPAGDTGQVEQIALEGLV